MTYKCPNCASALVYDIITDKLTCAYCNSSFFVDEIHLPEEEKAKAEAENIDNTTNETVAGASSTHTTISDFKDYDTMDCKIYSCKSCGAELMINDVEAATYCAYCGQPTIVFDRISKQRRPSHIIPFSVSKEYAVTAIRNRISKGAFVPDEIKNFKVDTLRGIYVPYWLVDLHYDDAMILSGKVRKGDDTETEYFYRHASVDFDHMTYDASKIFNDDMSKKLEPFDLSGLKPFKSGYLSGYYADCNDELPADLDKKAEYRAQLYFNEEIKKTVKASKVEIIKSRPRCTITKKVYVMFPVWFLVFTYYNKKYAMMVNGQTGKIVGTLPYKKEGFTVFWMSIAALLSVLLAPFFATFFSALMSSKDLSDLIILPIALAAACMTLAQKTYSRFKRNHELSMENNLIHYVQEREDNK